MTRLPLSARLIAATALVFGIQFAVSTQLEAASKVLKKAPFDPNAKQVELFDAMESGEINAKPITKDEFGGNILITNETEEPISVKMPQGFVVAPLAQFGGGGFGGGGQQGGGFGGGQGGGQQSAGGGSGGGQSGLGGSGSGGGGGGFFSIPPKKTLAVPYKSVCLEHGKPEPHPRSEYVIIPTEKFSQDPELITLIDMVGTGKLDPAVAQAAAWNISNDMSWQELAALKYNRLGRPDTPHFSRQQLLAAQQLVATAKHITEEGGLNKSKPAEPRTRASR